MKAQKRIWLTDRNGRRNHKEIQLNFDVFFLSTENYNIYFRN